ncbi:MAG: UDP-N-acetylenolpyruvoylglucosamine reductase [Gammaproteobacteria bacterium]|nr:MAG: UDP-N-acetylenolpyruvoylglucosamine reductase [Gammaproteobacteria bacterium]
MNVVKAITYRGQLLVDEPMSKHTSWRVGGTADYYYVPADLADLQYYLATLESGTAVNWIGLGSNMLVRDGGIRGVVIAPLNALRRLELNDEGRIYAEAGVTCAKLAKFVKKHGLTGAEFFAGIPGTIGGALAMNAGAFGGETWPLVEAVVMINQQGQLIERSASEFSIGYRSVSQFSGEWFAAAWFRFAAKTSETDSDIRHLLQKRNDSQPIGLPSCGSVFKNPAGQHAARLIEAAGLKGHVLGNASVSTKHANFIISNAQTRAADIEALIGYIRKVVKQQFGVELETEVRILGEQS